MSVLLWMAVALAWDSEGLGFETPDGFVVSRIPSMAEPGVLSIDGHDQRCWVALLTGDAQAASDGMLTSLQEAMGDPAPTTLGRWGRFRGAGVSFTGDLLGEATRVRSLAAEGLTVVEVCPQALIAELRPLEQSLVLQPVVEHPDLLPRACSQGDAGSCERLAVLHAAGAAGPVDYAAAQAHWETGCTAGIASSCYGLGMLADKGHAGPRDASLAASQYEWACAGGDPRACEGLSQLLRQGDGVARDEARADELAAKACAMGRRSACEG